MFCIALFIATTAFTVEPPVKEKVQQLFKTAFPDATNISWYQHGDYFDVGFEHNNIKCCITYDVNGSIVRASRYYYEKDLPLFIVAKVKNKYPDKKIYGVTEFTTPEEQQYYLILEDDKTWTTISADKCGNLTRLKKLTKA